MAGESIITPGYEEPTAVPEEVTPTELYLVRDNYLSEYADENEAAIVRLNLNVPSIDYSYDKATVDTKISETTKKAIEGYLNAEDPHGILPLVDDKIQGMVKQDGTTPFKLPQAGVDPISDNHLTTKKFVNKLLNEHKNATDPHEILPEVENMLEEYLKIKDMYKKSLIYTREEINKELTAFLKKDGSTPFTKALIGVEPTIDSHLTTKKYVDKSIYLHMVDVDPHGFIAILNNRLASYAKKKDVLDKTDTYSRTLIDNEISRIVETAIEQSLTELVDNINNKLENIRKQKYTKQDGTVPFKSPLSGVDATLDSHLTTLGLVTKLISEALESLDKKISNKECEWITSGPIEQTVGYLEEGTELPEKMTLQEIMDSIFYGKGVHITAPELANAGEYVDVTVCITGGLSLVESADLYWNGEFFRKFTVDEFMEDGCVTVQVGPITEDSEFEFRVYYSNGAEHDVTTEVKLAMPVFVGIMPEWYFGTYIVEDDLKELYNNDSVNNKYYDKDEHLGSILHYFNFDLEKPVRIILVMPASYPDLKTMSNDVQLFDLDSFLKEINIIPFTVAGKLVDYKIYIYSLELVRLDSKVTFKF